MKRAVILFVLLGLFLGCASLPVPEETENKTLLLIPLEWQLQQSYSSYGSYYVVIRRDGDTPYYSEEKVIPGKKFLQVENLPPGEYFVASAFFDNNSSISRRQSFTQEQCGFFMEPGKITLPPWGYLIQNKRKGAMMFLLNPADGNVVRQEALKFLEEKFPEEFAQWEITRQE